MTFTSKTIRTFHYTNGYKSIHLSLGTNKTFEFGHKYNHPRPGHDLPTWDNELEKKYKELFQKIYLYTILGACCYKGNWPWLPGVIGSVPTQGQILCDEHDHLFGVWV